MILFELGKIYNRQRDIHKEYGGQKQGGISTPKYPFIFLFTSKIGEKFGYKDSWDSNGVFYYTGEGQIGDMEFVRGNKAIRDHAENGKDILLFESLGKAKGCRFIGQFGCCSWGYQKGIDVNNQPRKIIVFHLVRSEDQNGALADQPINKSNLEYLRKRAYKAINPTQKTSKENKSFYYERSQAIRDYVLARAKGFCEFCEKPAPFNRKNGEYYLEPHHIRKISDGGPDHPLWVGAICPNCHREAHYGEKGNLVNKELKEVIMQKEEKYNIKTSR